MTSQYTRGSEWSKWDLHVHSPASSVQHYGPRDSDEAWGKFIADLEALPPEFKVIGINDYNFIEGYERTLTFKKDGRLKNIDLILPVIEFRVDTFVGTDNWREINFHVIFSDEVSPTEIKAQFLSGIESKYELAPDYSTSVVWDGIHTPESMIELGKKIQSTVPAAEKSKFDNHFHVGFSNLVCPLSKIKDLLEKPRFENKTVTAIGIAEWGQLKWTNQSIGAKKDHINYVDFSFTASMTLDDYEKSLTRLKTAAVNERLLHSSDAHYLSSDKSNHNKIGHCFTWIKANQTFFGLKHALYEFRDRIFVGRVPPKLTSVLQEPHRYIKSISIAKKKGAKAPDEWFENVGTMELNPGLVSIVGNQGSGKSALTDILGLAVRSKNQRDFSFLTDKSFGSKKEKLAESFETTIVTESGDTYSTSLDYKVSDSDTELARYIPQKFFDRICEDVESKGSEFEQQLHNAIFSHIPVSERHDFNSLDELSQYLTIELEKSVDFDRSEIRQINSSIVEVESQLKPSHRKKLENLREKKQRELDAHRKTKPTSINKPAVAKNKVLQGQVDEKKQAIVDLETQAKAAEKVLKSSNDLAEAFKKANLQLDAVETAIKVARSEFDKLKIPIKFKDVVKIRVDKGPVRENLALAKAEAVKQRKLIASQSSKLSELNEELANMTKRLDEPAEVFERYQKKLKTWEQQEQKIVGDVLSTDSLVYYQNEIEKLDQLPDRLKNLKTERIDRSMDAYNKLRKLADEYRSLYNAVQQFIDGDEIAKTLDISFDVSIVERGFVDQFLKMVDLTRKGKFWRGDSSELSQLLAKCDLNKATDVRTFLEEIDSLLSKVDSLSDILLTPLVDLYDLAFSLRFLEPTYILRLFGKEIDRLSPGERGSLLVIFYLLVDRDKRPLIIDQPEGNLDSQYIYETLVAAIRRAKVDRQIIIVTHNPNLAVGCDAEQLIHARIDRTTGTRVVYDGGAIENPKFKKIIIDKLEGTKPGFDNRRDKYSFGL